jgi:WD40 repeat protein
LDVGEFDQPTEGDVVLSRAGLVPPANGLVLGGLAGVQQQFQSDRPAERVVALQRAAVYGEAGLPLLVQALQDGDRAVRKMAYWLLQDRPEIAAQVALSEFEPYPLFECLHTLKGHQTGITAVAIGVRQFRYRVEQTVLISASREGVIKVWDLATREEAFSIKARSFIYAIAIDAEADTFTIRTEAQRLQSWSLRSGKATAPPRRMAKAIASTCKSGDHLISGSQNTIKVWNLQAGRETAVLHGHTSLVTAVAVSADRQWLVSGSEDRSLKLWGIG